MNFALYFYFRKKFRRKSYLFTRFLKLLIFLSYQKYMSQLEIFHLVARQIFYFYYRTASFSYPISIFRYKLKREETKSYQIYLS